MTLSICGTIGRLWGRSAEGTSPEHRPDPAVGTDPQRATSAFFVQPADVEGVFGNGDVDSEVYRYVTKADTPDAYWSSLESQATKDGWIYVPSTDGSVRRFVRLGAPNSDSGFWSVWEARVKKAPDSATVVVGWVRADSKEKPRDVSLSGVSKDFADRRVWPIVERSTASE